MMGRLEYEQEEPTMARQTDRQTTTSAWPVPCVPLRAPVPPASKPPPRAAPKRLLRLPSSDGRFLQQNRHIATTAHQRGRKRGLSPYRKKSYCSGLARRIFTLQAWSALAFSSMATAQNGST